MSIHKKVVVVDETSTLNKLIKELVDKSKPYFGFACIVNKKNELKGFSILEFIKSFKSRFYYRLFSN